MEYKINHRIRSFTDILKKQFLFNKDSNYKLSLSVAIGIFAAIFPIWGFQSVLAVLLSFIFKANKILAIAVSNISQPPVTPIIIFLSLITGSFFVGKAETGIINYSSVNSAAITNYLKEYIVGSVVLAFIAASFFGFLTYLLLFFLRKNASAN